MSCIRKSATIFIVLSAFELTCLVGRDTCQKCLARYTNRSSLLVYGTLGKSLCKAGKACKIRRLIWQDERCFACSMTTCVIYSNSTIHPTLRSRIPKINSSKTSSDPCPLHLLSHHSHLQPLHIRLQLLDSDRLRTPLVDPTLEQTSPLLRFPAHGRHRDYCSS